MSRSTTLTPKQIRQIRAARAAGASMADAAAVARCTKDQVQRLEARTPKKRKEDAAPAVPPGPTVEELMAKPLPVTGDPEAIVELRLRAARVRALLETLAPLVQAQEYPAAQYVTLAKYGDDIVRRIAELTPPAPPNPDEDAATIEAERTLLERIEAMVRAEEDIADQHRRFSK